MTKTIALCAFLFGAAVANAQPASKAPTAAEKKAQAKALYEKGLSAYNLGKFTQAIDAFTKAYELSQAPGLLFNIAQSHRLNKDYEKASFFYSTYLRLKPDAANRADVEQRIQEMDKALEEQRKIESRPPTGTMNPEEPTTTPPKPPVTAPTTTTTTTTTTTQTPVTTTVGTTGATTTGATAATTRPATATDATTRTGAIERPDGPADTSGVTASVAPQGATLLSARFTGGVALLKSSDLDIPVQPSIGITAAYPLPLGPVTIELGAGFSWTPLPYENAMGQQRGRMVGVRAVVGVVREIAPKIQVRGDLGAGIVSLGGLQEGNPISDMRQAQSFTRPSFRVGVSADYLITPNLAAYVSPFGIAFSSASPEMYGGLREIDILVGVGYRQ
jgi:hypothetical protein